MNLSRQDAFYLARVVLMQPDEYPFEELQAHPYLKALVEHEVIANADQVLQVLGRDALKCVLAEDPTRPYTPDQGIDHVVDAPPLPPTAKPRPEDLEAGQDVGRWWRRYVEWATATANQSPTSYHKAIGLWIAGLAIGRRVYVHAPWDVKVFANQYTMLLGETTYYRKSTAYGLGEYLVRAAIPHMLLPQPGSAEHFTRMLAGKMPDNFNELAPTDKVRLLAGRAFAAQRGLVWDELSGMFGSSRKDFMAGFKQDLLRIYDSPDLMDWETGKHGRTVVRSGSLSILGATTPADLAITVGEENWRDGLLARFAIIMPEADFEDRPPLKRPDIETQEALKRDLARLHRALPAPEVSEDPTAPIPPGEPPRALVFEAWPEVIAYGDALREWCNPDYSELDSRLFGFYGRLHTLGVKVALVLAMMDWAENAAPDAPPPTVTRAHWACAWQLTETWRTSLHQALDVLDVTREARQEQRDDQKVKRVLRRHGPAGCKGRTLGKYAKIGSERLEKSLRRLITAGEVFPVDPPANSQAHDWYIYNFRSDA